jgi:hypothetical protein
MIRVGPFLLALSFAAVQTAEGQVPRPADVVACNEEASQMLKAGAASPTTDDHARAARARGDPKAATPTEAASGIIESADPQIHGMNAQGAQSAEYQAAYRSCMRRKGF